MARGRSLTSSTRCGGRGLRRRTLLVGGRVGLRDSHRGLDRGAVVLLVLRSVLLTMRLLMMLRMLLLMALVLLVLAMRLLVSLMLLVLTMRLVMLLRVLLVWLGSRIRWLSVAGKVRST